MSRSDKGGRPNCKWLSTQRRLRIVLAPRAAQNPSLASRATSFKEGKGTGYGETSARPRRAPLKELSPAATEDCCCATGQRKTHNHPSRFARHPLPKEGKGKRLPPSLPHDPPELLLERSCRRGAEDFASANSFRPLRATPPAGRVGRGYGKTCRRAELLWKGAVARRRLRIVASGTEF